MARYSWQAFRLGLAHFVLFSGWFILRSLSGGHIEEPPPPTTIDQILDCSFFVLTFPSVLFNAVISTFDLRSIWTFFPAFFGCSMFWGWLLPQLAVCTGRSALSAVDWLFPKKPAHTQTRHGRVGRIDR